VASRDLSYFSGILSLLRNSESNLLMSQYLIYVILKGGNESSKAGIGVL